MDWQKTGNDYGVFEILEISVFEIRIWRTFDDKFYFRVSVCGKSLMDYYVEFVFNTAEETRKASLLWFERWFEMSKKLVDAQLMALNLDCCKPDHHRWNILTQSDERVKYCDTCGADFTGSSEDDNGKVDY